MRQVAVEHDEPGALEPRLQSAQRGHVRAQRHHRHVGLVAEDRGRDDLAIGGLGVVDRLDHRTPVDRLSGRAEEVEDADARFHAHGAQATEHGSGSRAREPLRARTR